MIGTLPIFRGTYDSVAVWPREVVKEALMRGGTQIIVVHNHPNGKLEPSREDEELTKALERACAPKEIGLKFVDHVIVTPNGYYSFREQNLINKSA